MPIVQYLKTTVTGVDSMFERFTEQAIKAIIDAQAEMRRLRQDELGCEHILLGLLANGKSQEAASRCCDKAYIHRDARIEVEKLPGGALQSIC